VALTASASVLTPLSMRCRALSPNTTSFAMILIP